MVSKLNAWLISLYAFAILIITSSCYQIFLSSHSLQYSSSPITWLSGFLYFYRNLPFQTQHWNFYYQALQSNGVMCHPVSFHHSPFPLISARFRSLFLLISAQKEPNQSPHDLFSTLLWCHFASHWYCHGHFIPYLIFQSCPPLLRILPRTLKEFR